MKGGEEASMLMLSFVLLFVLYSSVGDWFKFCMIGCRVL